MNLHISDFTSALVGTPFAARANAAPWDLTASIETRVREAIATLDASDWQNAVPAPGTLLSSRTVAPLLALIDQELGVRP